MVVTALVMAGGRGSRLKLPEEKPIVPLNGTPMIDRVIEALRGARSVSRIVVCVSRHTPRTASRMRERGLEVVEAPGDGYVADMRYAVKRLKLGKTLVVNADLPFVSSGIIDRVVSVYERSRKPALSVMCSLEVYAAHGLRPEYRFAVGGREVSPVGLNLVDGEKIGGGELKEEELVLDDVELAYNINTVRDIQIAERAEKDAGE
jgi:adenosylcobinamide-phosphate guanylyltransferase